MLSEERKKYLSEQIKYNPTGKPSFLLKLIRSNPYLYSLVSKSRVWISRNIFGREAKNLLNKNQKLFQLNEEELKHIENLKRDGYTIFENYFDENFIDEIEKKIDPLFKNLEINKKSGYNVAHKRFSSLDNMSYEEIAFTEESVGLVDPLLKVNEFVSVAFRENFLKIICNYLGFIPKHRVGISRAFPHNPPMESSYFHKDSDNHDVLHIFVYLVDVDDNGGPFCYIPKTHKNDIKSCRPITNFDLGLHDSYGRISDKEMEKYYPKDEWIPIKAKRGSVVITHVNGFHKGPLWADMPIKDMKARDILHVNFRGLNNMSDKIDKKYGKIYKKDIENFSDLQRIFLKNYEIIED